MTLKLFFFILPLLFFSNASVALGKLGHQVVCQLAFEHLPSTKQAQIVKLLKTIPQKHRRLINNYNYKKQDGSITFADACTWADAIKRFKKFKPYQSWHFMNVPRDHINIEPNDCHKNCLPQAIIEHQQILAGAKNRINWKQAQALFFLSHWLGDIHQPLHISFANDLGGNNIKFTHLTTKCKNLHWYWDECILYKGNRSKKKWLTLLTKQWQLIPDQNWEKELVWQWADESFQIVKSESFKYCQVDDQGSCQQLTNKIKLPENYLQQHQGIIEKRMLLAAHRLTAVLIASL